MDTARAVLEIESLTVEFPAPGGTREVLRGVSFGVPRGVIVALVGGSGSGKTVTARAVMGLLDTPGTKVSGRILLTTSDGAQLGLLRSGPGDDARNGYPRQAAARAAAITFQSPAAYLNPFWTIGKQFRRLANGRDPYDFACEWLRKVQIGSPESIVTRYPHQLSGGEATRVAVALSLAIEPDLWIADEPTAGLDLYLRNEVAQLMRRVHKSQPALATLLITHDMGLVRRLADRIAVLHEGRIVDQFDPSEGLPCDAHPHTVELMGADLERRKRVRRPSAGGGPPADASGSPMLEAGGLGKHYRGTRRVSGRDGAAGSFWAVHGVDLRIRRGERVAVVGESGCGKTTLAGMVSGFLCATRGRVRIQGYPVRVRLLGQDLDLRRRLQVIFQDADALLHPRVTIREQLHQGLGWHAGRRYRQVEELAQEVGLHEECLDQFPAMLSGGERRRAGLAKVLAAGPALIVADEPFSGLDGLAQLELSEALTRTLDLTGAALLLVTHDLMLARSLCDRVVVMFAGMLVEECPVGAFTLDSPHHPYAADLLFAERFEKMSLQAAESIAKAHRDATGEGPADQTSTQHDRRPADASVACPYVARCGYQSVAKIPECSRIARSLTCPVGAGRTNCVLSRHLRPLDSSREVVPW